MKKGNGRSLIEVLLQCASRKSIIANPRMQNVHEFSGLDLFVAANGPLKSMSSCDLF
jgi:hypothetical protein